jgi:hypothetical protein
VFKPVQRAPPATPVAAVTSRIAGLRTDEHAYPSARFHHAAEAVSPPPAVVKVLHFLF